MTYPFYRYRRIAALCLVACFAVASTAVFVTPVVADWGDPCAKYKKGSKKWKKCKGYKYRPGVFKSDDERFMAGYWLAKNGRYAEALSMLRGIEAGNDARVLNYIGFATRKLGRVDEALTYYRRAVQIAPDYVMSRAYMGEAFVSKGDLAAAKGQLDEIERRCGNSCEAYVNLKKAIDRET